MNFDNLGFDDVVFLLSTNDEKLIKKLFEKAYKTKLKYVKNKVYFRGIIEFSNICEKNCYYCGIRKDNKEVKRYFMTEDEILSAAKWAYENNYGSLVLQSGEQTNVKFIDFIEDILFKIKDLSNGELGITLSLGEQSFDTYQRWFNAGAHRYLLRIETSNPNLYKKLHPSDHSFENRVNCVKNLKEIGYQTGTGVMIGLPYQTDFDLAQDIYFFMKNDIDMIGMGPYVLHHQTPLAKKIKAFDKKKQLEKSLKMIALTRLVLKDVNIAATTALQALKDDGRELGLKAGANIIMPVITDVKYRKDYLLYEDKPCIDENAKLCKSCLEMRIRQNNEEIAYGKWGDSPHYYRRRQNG